MLLSCPSCKKSYDTSKYKGQFEIDCDCGYSILIPDEDSINQTKVQELGFSSPPIALEEEDEQKIIEVNTSHTFINDNLFEPNPQIAPFDGSVQLSNETDLPEEMAYDPDEAEALAQSKATWTESSSNIDTFVDPLDNEDSLKNNEPLNNENNHLEEQTPAQTLIIQNQMISVGKFTGSHFDLDLSELSEEALLKVNIRFNEILNSNPWILNLLGPENSKLNPQSIIKNKRIVSIPEVIAMELFLYCYEIGGSCKALPAEPL